MYIFLQKTSVEGGDELNIIMSTYSIWNLLAILNEGASGATQNQIQSVLRLPRNNNQFRVGYKNIGSALTVSYYNFLPSFNFYKTQTH